MKISLVFALGRAGNQLWRAGFYPTERHSSRFTDNPEDPRCSTFRGRSIPQKTDQARNGFPRWSDLPTNSRPQMKGFETGSLMLLVCTALYIQIDPRIWNNICQLLARLMIGTN
jgi:hypothetical protein